MRAETRNSALLVAGVGTTAVLSMVYNAIAARWIGPSEFAVFTTALSLVALANAAFGPINGTLARFTAVYETRGERGKIMSLSRGCLRLCRKYSLYAAIPAILAAKPIAAALKLDSIVPLLVTFAIVFITIGVSVSRGVLRGVQDFLQYNFNSVFEASTRLVAGIAILAVLPTASWGLGAFVVGGLATLILSRRQLSRLWGETQPEPIDVAVVKRYTLPMMILMLSAAGYVNMDMLIIKNGLADAEAGIYGATFTLARVISVLVTPFNLVLLPLIASLHESGKPIAGAVGRIAGYFFLLVAGPTLVLVLKSDWIVNKIYGAEFAEAAALLLPLTIVRLISYTTYLLALASASTSSFRFLWIYVTGLCAQTAGMIIWSESPRQLIDVMLVCQAATLVGMVVFFGLRTRVLKQKRGQGDAQGQAGPSAGA